MTLLLIEGQPGTGKTIYSEIIVDYLRAKGVQHSYVDESIQDSVIFGDYWGLVLPDWRAIAEQLLYRWRGYLDGHLQECRVHIFDNCLLNQVQYLMILNAPGDAIKSYFQKVCEMLPQNATAMILLEGNAESLTKSIIRLRTNGWAERVSKLLESMPYQRKRNSTGIQGMIEFFKDAGTLKEQLLAHCPFRIIRYDARTQECRTLKPEVVGFLEGRGEMRGT